MFIESIIATGCLWISNFVLKLSIWAPIPSSHYWRCKLFEFSSDLAREFPRKEEVIMSKCWRILKYIGTPCPRSALGLANIKITQETRDPASNIQTPESHVTIIETGRNWKYIRGKHYNDKRKNYQIKIHSSLSIFVYFCQFQNEASRHLGLSHVLWMCFVKFVYFLSKAPGHIIIIIPKVENIVRVGSK